MSSDDIALSIRNVSKCFEIYEKPVHRLFQTLCAGHKRFYKEFWALKDISVEVRRGGAHAVHEARQRVVPQADVHRLIPRKRTARDARAPTDGTFFLLFPP